MRRPQPFQLTSKVVLTILGFVAMIASGLYWWGIQSKLTDDHVIAAAYTAILVLAPPALTSFLIPWSPGGMLLQKVNARTWGYMVVVTCALFLFYYSYQIQWSWWSAQRVVAGADLIFQQSLIGIIGFIVIPALLWAPVSSEELVEQVKQAHLVKRYELQTQADIAILRATLLRAQEMALIGFANLTVEQRNELAVVLRSLVSGIHGTLEQIGTSVKAVSGATVHFQALEDNADIRDVLEYIHDSLLDTNLAGEEAPAPQRPASTSAGRGRGRQPVTGDTAPQRALPTRPVQRVPYIAFKTRSGKEVEAAVLRTLRNGDVLVVDQHGEEFTIRKAQILETFDKAVAA